MKYDGTNDYLIWERQIKGKLKAIGMSKSLNPKPSTYKDENQKHLHEQNVSIVNKTFGSDNKDMYIAFDGLLSCHLSS